MISGLDIHYELGGGHPLVGRRMPDLDLRTADGTRASEIYAENFADPDGHLWEVIWMDPDALEAED